MEPGPVVARAQKGKQRATTSQESKEDESDSRRSDVCWENLAETAGLKETTQWCRRVMGTLCHLHTSLHYS